MGKEAVEINDLFLEVVRPFVNRLGVLGVLQKRDFQTVCSYVTLLLRFVLAQF